MPEEQPEKLVLGGGGYLHDSQSFTLKVSSQWGTATAGERANFQISADVIVRDGSGELGRASGSSPVRKSGDATPGSTSVPLEDALVPWDRAGGTVTGTVDISVTARLTKNGNVIGGSEASATFTGIDVGGRTTPS